MSVHKENIPYDGNEIYELKEEYLEDSVKVLYGNNKEIGVTEVGGRFISLSIPDDIELGDTLKVSYKTPQKVIRKFDTDRLRALEEIVLTQQKAIEELQKALNHRMSIRTFTTWARTVEEKLGVNIIEQSFQTPYPH